MSKIVHGITSGLVMPYLSDINGLRTKIINNNFTLTVICLTDLRSFSDLDHSDTFWCSFFETLWNKMVMSSA